MASGKLCGAMQPHVQANPMISRHFRPALAIAAIALCLIAAGCSRIRSEINETRKEINARDSAPPVWSPPANESPNLAFGNPSNAELSDRNNFLILGDGHAISYNDSRGTANWAAWRTTRADLGERLPRPDFRPDPRLPAGFRRIEYFHYSGSGFDRGHLVPSADRFGNRKLNEETFYMTNIVPQTGSLNQFPWEKLESFSRSLVYRGNDLYTVAGCYGDKGHLKKRVTVPTNCWKVIVVLKAGAAIETVNASTRIIAVDIPNIDGIENDVWEKYRTTVREIERRTGYDLLSALPAELQETLENSLDAK